MLRTDVSICTRIQRRAVSVMAVAATLIAALSIAPSRGAELNAFKNKTISKFDRVRGPTDRPTTIPHGTWLLSASYPVIHGTGAWCMSDEPTGNAHCPSSQWTFKVETPRYHMHNRTHLLCLTHLLRLTTILPENAMRMGRMHANAPSMPSASASEFSLAHGPRARVAFPLSSATSSVRPFGPTCPACGTSRPAPPLCPPIHPPCHQANVPWLSPPDIRYPYEGVHNDLLTMLKIRQLSRWVSVFMFNQVGVYVYRACITCVLLVYRMCTAHVPHPPVVQPMVSVFICINASSVNFHSPLPARCQSDTPRSLPSLYSGCHPVDTQQHLLVHQGALLGCSTISYVLLTWSASDLSPR